MLLVLMCLGKTNRGILEYHYKDIGNRDSNLEYKGVDDLAANLFYSKDMQIE
jgi:hypothetical protein